MPDHTLGGTALLRCIEEDYEGARKIIGAMSVPELKLLRQGCVDLDNEIVCLVETAAKPKAGER